MRRDWRLPCEESRRSSACRTADSWCATSLQAPAERPYGQAGCCQAGVAIGSVGRLDGVKGYETLLDALASLTDAHLLLVGDGPERAALEDRARRIGISDRLSITGWVAEPRALLSSLDVFVLPSRLESFPLSIVEAMLAGLPVVATDVGSVAEAVVEGETGLLVPPGDAVALAAAIRSLADDPELRIRLGRNGRMRALELFTATSMAHAFDSAYREALATR